jgi:hypothetical protein
LVAVTRTRRVVLRSADERLAVDEVAPAIALQLAPPESQRSHWYTYLKLLPSHRPTAAVRELPTCVVPLMDGGVRFTGASWPGAEVLPAPAPVTRIVATATAAKAIAMWRLIALSVRLAHALL